MIGPPEAGQLLIATDPGKGGYFDRSVILILEHNDSGTLGVVLNRPSGHEVPPLLEEWETMLSPPAVPFEGGPISQQAVVALGQLANPADEPPGWKPLFDDVGLVDLDTPIELVDGAFSHVRMFVALSGWEANQLQGELIRGLWFRARARSEEIFGLPDDLWRRVLRRLGGAAARWSTWTSIPVRN